MLSCRKLVEQAMEDPELLNPGRKRSWQVRLHLLVCGYCRRFVNQLSTLLQVLSLMPAYDRTANTTVDEVWNRIRRQSAGSQDSPE